MADPDQRAWLERKLGLAPGALDPSRHKPMSPDDPVYQEMRRRHLDQYWDQHVRAKSPQFSRSMRGKPK